MGSNYVPIRQTCIYFTNYEEDCETTAFGDTSYSFKAQLTFYRFQFVFIYIETIAFEKHVTSTKNTNSLLSDLFQTQLKLFL